MAPVDFANFLHETDSSPLEKRQTPQKEIHLPTPSVSGASCYVQGG